MSNDDWIEVLKLTDCYTYINDFGKRCIFSGIQNNPFGQPYLYWTREDRQTPPKLITAVARVDRFVQVTWNILRDTEYATELMGYVLGHISGG